MELPQVLEVEAERGPSIGEDGNPGGRVEALQTPDNAEGLVLEDEGGGGVKLVQSHHEA